MLITRIQILHMNTVKLHVPHGKFMEVYETIRKNGVKYYPIRRVTGGHEFEVNDHPVVSYLILKFDLNTIQE